MKKVKHVTVQVQNWKKKNVLKLINATEILNCCAIYIPTSYLASIIDT